MLIFAYWGWLLLCPVLAIVHAVFAVRTRHGVQWLCAGLWLLPPLYEILVLANCTGECNIRADLLYVWPAEIAVLVTLSAYARRARRGHSTR